MPTANMSPRNLNQDDRLSRVPPSNVIPFHTSGTVGQRPVFYDGAADAEPSVRLTTGDSVEQKYWDVFRDVPLSMVSAWCLNHDIRPDKDGPCFFPATVYNGTRRLKFVEDVTLAVFDVDGGQSLADAITALERIGLRGFLYTSYGHRTSQSEAEVAKYEPWATKNNQPLTPTDASLAQYFADKKKPRTNVKLGSHNGAPYKNVPGTGNVYIADHDPVDKFRVMVLLTHPIRIADLHANTDKGIAEYNAIYHGVGTMLGLNYDHSCSDPTRLYYFASCPEERKADAFAREFEGKPLDWRTVERVYLDKGKKACGSVSESPGAGHPDDDSDYSFGPYDLRAWNRNARGFDIEALAQQIGAATTPRSAGNGYTVECPFDSEHTVTGGQGTFCANADDRYSWTVDCRHNSCQSAGRKKLDFLKAWLASGKVTIDDLQSAEFNGAPVPLLLEISPEVANAVIDATLNENATDDAFRHAIDVASRLPDEVARVEARTRIERKAPPRLTASMLKTMMKEALARTKAERKERKEQARAYVEAQAKATLSERYKWVLDAGGYYDVAAGKLRKKEDVYTDVLPFLPPEANAARVMTSEADSRFDRLAYAPDKPSVFIDERGLRCLNTYAPPSLQPIEGDATPWLAHVDYVFEGDKNAVKHFLDWAAYKVQHPATKIRHGMLITSFQGMGKGTLARPLKPIFGASNYVEPDNKELVEGKLQFMEGKTMVVILELKAAKRSDVANRLKPVITEDTIRIEPKYVNAYTIENPASVLAFTNYYSALHLEHSDRRWYVFRHRKTDPKPDTYFDALHEWFDGDGCGIVYHYLLHRDVSGFRPSAPPPVTTDKLDAITSSRGDLAEIVRERFEDEAAPFHRDLTTIAEAHEYFANIRGLNITRNQLRAVLLDLGAGPLNPNDGSTYYRDKTGERRSGRLWALRKAAHWASASEQARGEEYAKPE